MTRFARAHGSKASNVRAPEEATSWHVMKQQIEEHRVKHQYGKDADNIQSLELHKSSSKPAGLNRISKVWEEFTDCIEPDETNCKDTFKESEKQFNCKRVIKKCKDNLAKHAEVVNSVSHDKATNCLKSNGYSFVIDKETRKQKEQTESCINKDIFINNNKRAAENYIDVPVSYNNVKPRSENNTVCKKRKNIDEISVTKNEFDVKSSFGNDRKEFNKDKKRRFTNFNTEMANKKEKFNNSETQSFKPTYDNGKQYAVNDKYRMNNSSYFQGYAVKKEDADRLYKLRKDLRANGVTRKAVLATLDAERRKAEKALARDKKVLCYKCRQFGHSMSDCPELEVPSGICFKCGSTEHSAKTCCVVKGDSFKFTHCFICQEQGHISRQCPDNPRGLYPKGGSCKMCGDVTHLRSDCPSLVNEKEKNRITVGIVDDESIEGLDEEFVKVKKDDRARKTEVIKF